MCRAVWAWRPATIASTRLRSWLLGRGFSVEGKGRTVREREGRGLRGR